MKQRIRKLVNPLLVRSGIRHWRKIRQEAENASNSDLVELRRTARQMKRVLNDVDAFAFEQLTLPKASSTAMKKPRGCDWSFRPKPWASAVTPKGLSPVKDKSKFSDDITLFHDAPTSEISLRQIRNRKQSYLAPFAVRIDALHFQSSFLSILVSPPNSLLEDLTKEYLVQVRMIIENEVDPKTFVRLNLQNGASHEEIAQQVSSNGKEIVVDFDLFYSKFSPDITSKIWFDLIFENTEFNEITLRDLTFHRYPRAKL